MGGMLMLKITLLVGVLTPLVLTGIKGRITRFGAPLFFSGLRR